MKALLVNTRDRAQMVDVTDQVRGEVRASGVLEGICLIYSPHTTCGVTVNEGWDPAVASDAIGHLRELVPQGKAFRHTEGNSDSHIQTMLVGNSAAVPVTGGELKLGRWQAIFLCEFDGPRERELWISLSRAE